LWGRSANRCALCRFDLCLDAQCADSASIVGDECHLRGQSEGGPRYDPAYSLELIDSYENLILLCKVHHKLVDDDWKTYTTEKLERIKAAHGNWVTEALEKPPNEDLPREEEVMPRVYNGTELLIAVGGSMAYQFDHDHPATQEEADALSGFLQNVQDYGELYSDFGSGERVQAACRVSEEMQQLAELGFWIFAESKLRKFKIAGEVVPDWRVAYMRVVKSSNPTILSTDIEALQKAKGSN